VLCGPEEMLDTHGHPDNWGVAPTLFHIGKVAVPSYEVLVLAGLVVGALVYRHEARRADRDNERSYLLAFAALMGGTLGAKLPHWIRNFQLIVESYPDLTPALAGRTIVGGLIAGTLGVVLAKRLLGIKSKHGNLFAPAAALGVAIGRMGCFLRGCCHGTPTSMPWGVEFGDGVFRHPTQLYEIVFALGMFVYFQFAKRRNPRPGLLFRQFLVGYFAFRFLTEFLRPEPKSWWGLSSFQVISLLMLVWLFRDHIRSFCRQKFQKPARGGVGIHE